MRTFKEKYDLEDDPIVRHIFTKDRPDSIVTKICVKTRENKEHNLYLKTYKNQDLDSQALRLKLLKEFNILKSFSEDQKLQSSCRVIKPFSCYPELLTIVTEEHGGVTLSSLIGQHTVFHSDQKTQKMLGYYCRLSGEWLSRFQAISKNIQAPPFILDETIKDIYSKLDRCADRRSLHQDIYGKLLQYMNKTILQLKPDSICLSGMHSDYIPSNILVDKDQITVLDFSDFRSGPVCRDPITFLLSLDNYLWNPLFRSKTIRRLQEQFLEGYGTCFKKEDVLLIKILEIRETLGELINLACGETKGWFSSMRYKRINSFLMRRLVNSLDNEVPHFLKCQNMAFS